LKILIIRLSSLGDIILTQPVVLAVHQLYPDAELHFLTKEQFQSLPGMFGVKLTVLCYQKTLKWHLKLLHSHYDLVIDLHAKLSTWLIKLATLPARQVTYQKQHQLRRAIVSHQTDQAISSTLDAYGTVFGKTGLPAVKKLTHPVLYPPAGSVDIHLLSTGRFAPIRDQSQDDVSAGNVLQDLSCRDCSSAGSASCSTNSKVFLAVFPGATHQTKQYPAELFIRVIQMLPEHYIVLLMGSPQEKELTAQIHYSTAQKSLDLGGKYTLDELTCVVSQVDCVLSNDSGPMHLAAALGRPQVAIFGATHPRLGFAPLNAKAVVLCQNLDCQPCSLHGAEVCPQRHFACMLEIKPEEVLAAILKIKDIKPAGAEVRVA
jgi:heptosyltransferase-2